MAEEGMDIKGVVSKKQRRGQADPGKRPAGLLYQAKSTREYLAHVSAAQSQYPVLRKQLLADEQRYAKEKTDVQKKAAQLEEEAARLDAKAEAALKPHRHMALAITLTCDPI